MILVSRLLAFGVGALAGGGVVYGVSKLAKKYGFLTSLFGATDAGDGLTALPASSDPNALSIAARQIRRYAFASSQDKSPIVGLTHASYALVLLDTVEEMVPRAVILQASGVDPGRLRQFITKLQDYHAEQLHACDPFLTKILNMERSDGEVLPGTVLAGVHAALGRAGISAPRGA